MLILPKGRTTNYAHCLGCIGHIVKENEKQKKEKEMTEEKGGTRRVRKRLR